MTIFFDNLPATIRRPGAYAEFNANRAAQGPAVQRYRGLLIGQRIAGEGTSSSVDGTPEVVTVTSAEQVEELTGRGSMAHRMALRWFENNRFVDLDLAVIEDATTAVAQVRTITFSGTATGSGTLYLYIGGRRHAIGVASGATAASVASDLATAMAADDLSPYTASAAGAVVTLTAKNAGAVAEQYQVIDNVLAGEESVPGLSWADAVTTNGATNPDVNDVFAITGDTQYHIIAFPWRDSANTSALETELIRKDLPTVQAEGFAILSHKELSGAAASYLAATLDNSEYIARWAYQGHQPEEEVAAATCAVVAGSAQDQPARPFQTLRVTGLLPVKGLEFTNTEIESIHAAGFSHFQRSDGGDVFIGRLRTTRTKTDTGVPTEVWEDANTRFTLSYIRFSWRNRILTKYPRAFLRDDGDLSPSAGVLMTPSIGRAETLDLAATDWVPRNIVENLEQFENDLIVERNSTDPNRLDFLIAPDLVNQFRIAAASIQFLR